MNRDEALKELKAELAWHERVPGREVPLTEGLRFAIAELEALEDRSKWQDHPTCPDCGTFMQEDFGDWTCGKCEKHFIVEEAYRVLGPDEERNRFTEELKARAANKTLGGKNDQS